MRKLFTISLMCLFMLLAVSSSAPRSVRATIWVDLFLDCASFYADDAHDCEALYPPGSSRNQCLNAAQSQNTSCLQPMYYPTYEPDYCDQARAANAACINLFTGLESTFLVMECSMNSGINACQ